jgi:hypothetical protein
MGPKRRGNGGQLIAERLPICNAGRAWSAGHDDRPAPQDLIELNGLLETVGCE